MNAAATITALRANGTTIADIAAQVGVHISTVYRWLKGSFKPIAARAAALAAMLAPRPSTCARCGRTIADGETEHTTDYRGQAQTVHAGGCLRLIPSRRPASMVARRRRQACKTGGNCSSHSGRNCGGYNCDAN